MVQSTPEVRPISSPSTVSCRFLPEDRAIEAEVGTTILDAAHANDIPVETVCAGKGTCGTCRVLVRDVAVPEPTPHDKRRLAIAQLAGGWRLACQHPVDAGAVYSHPLGIRAVRVVESAGLGRISLDPTFRRFMSSHRRPRSTIPAPTGAWCRTSWPPPPATSIRRGTR